MNQMVPKFIFLHRVHPAGFRWGSFAPCRNAGAGICCGRRRTVKLLLSDDHFARARREVPKFLNLFLEDGSEHIAQTLGVVANVSFWF